MRICSSQHGDMVLWCRKSNASVRMGWIVLNLSSLKMWRYLGLYDHESTRSCPAKFSKLARTLYTLLSLFQAIKYNCILYMYKCTILQSLSSTIHQFKNTQNNKHRAISVIPISSIKLYSKFLYI